MGVHLHIRVCFDLDLLVILKQLKVLHVFANERTCGTPACIDRCIDFFMQFEYAWSRFTDIKTV
jgi:hypothetical protein